MNIFDFTKDKDSDTQYDYKILVYPNITYMQDLEKDSYVVVLRNVIKELNKIRNDIHFTILSPTEIQSLVFENTTQIPINLPSYPNAMRTHFNFTELKNILTSGEVVLLMKIDKLQLIKMIMHFQLKYTNWQKDYQT